MNRRDRFNPKKGLKGSMLFRHGQTRNLPARRSAAKEGNPKTKYDLRSGKYDFEYRTSNREYWITKL